MARDFIKINTQSVDATQASSLKQYVSVLRDAYDRGKEIKAIMDHNQDGTVFTDLETLFGIPTGKGQVVYDMVNGSVGSMEGTFQVPDVKNLTERLG